MWHSHCNVLDTVVHGTIDESFHAGNERLAAFKAEALFVGILARNEFLEGLGPDKAVKNHSLFLQSVVPRFWDFDALANPIALFLVRDVDILDSDSTT